MDEIITEYDQHYFESSDHHLPESKKVELKAEFAKIPIIDNNLKTSIYNHFFNEVFNQIKEANIEIRKSLNSIKEKCPCSACPKYLFNETTQLYELTKVPTDNCLFTSCAFDDLTDMINNNLQILKIKKLKRGSNKNADLSIYDLNEMRDRIKSNLSRGLEVINNKFISFTQKEDEKKENSNKLTSKFYIPLSISVIMGLIIILIIILLIIYFIKPDLITWIWTRAGTPTKT